MIENIFRLTLLALSLCLMLGCSNFLKKSVDASRQSHNSQSGSNTPLDAQISSAGIKGGAGSKIIVEAPTLAALLKQRAGYCTLDKEHRSKEAERLLQEQSLLASLQLLLVSTCRPEMTPGIMRSALEKLNKIDNLPTEYQSFFSIVSAQLNATDTLTKQQQELIEKLNETVEELTKIERDIESRDSPLSREEPFSR